METIDGVRAGCESHLARSTPVLDASHQLTGQDGRRGTYLALAKRGTRLSKQSKCIVECFSGGQAWLYDHSAMQCVKAGPMYQGSYRGWRVVGLFYVMHTSSATKVYRKRKQRSLQEKEWAARD